MKLRHRNVPFKLKEISDEGEFAGYASVFDVVDWYNDVIKPGAFARTLGDWAKRGKLPPILWQHNSREPIGPHTVMREDSKGLYVEGRLLVDEIPEARKAYACLKNDVIDGMSIGFDIFEDGMDYDGKTNVWNLTALDLWENSIVTFAANPDARVDQVKTILAAGKLPSLSEFEDFLRDAGGFSRKQAKTIAACGLKVALRDAGEAAPPRDAEDEKGVADAISELATYVKRYGT
jgi:HK97 family phage prohead protease